MPRSRSADSFFDTTLTRRDLLAGGLTLLATPYLRAASAIAGPFDSAQGRPAGARWAANPFTLGVASGDPAPDGVVLWTRLATDPLNGGGMTATSVDVVWEIAADESMKKIVRKGTARAEAAWAHSVHVEVDGLEPDHEYWYRFRTGDADTVIARTRTLPRVNSSPDDLKFAFVSCQNYEQGLFTAYRHLAGEELDMVFHLGDYIYEGAGLDNRPRKHVGGKLTTLDDYRNRYAQYKMDPDLQAAHARSPWWMTWDDHEVENNYANDLSSLNEAQAAFLRRRAAAYHAYYEHMPLRRTSLPRGPAAQIYRRFHYGSLAGFFILDTRQYRTDQPCADGSKVPCEATFSPKATLMGETQEKWFFDSMRASKALWNVVPQQVMMARVDQFPGAEARYSMDQWPGYDRELTRVMQFFATARPSNPIVLTGDIHSSWVNDLKADFIDPKSAVVATEFVGTSISSGGDGTAEETPRMAGVLSENPFVKFQNSQRGYVSCEIKRSSMTADYCGVDFVTRPDAPKHTRASFVVDNGRPGAHKR